MDNSVLKHIADRIDAEIDASSEALSMGKAQDYGDYKWKCGIVRGYLLAKGIMLETAEHIEGSDD